MENASFGGEMFVAEDLMCKSNVVVHDSDGKPQGQRKPVVRGDGIKMAEVDSCAQFTIFSGSDESKPQAILKSLVDGSSQQLQVAPVEGGLYNVEYTPKTRGQHHLLISVEDQPIPGSPFSVLVKIHPTKLDKPVRKIEGINPWYGTFNSSGELVVGDYSSKNVVVFDKKGEQIRSISEAEDVCGVAVDKEDNIYISDRDNQCVHKFNKKGDLLKKIGQEGKGPGEFNYPVGIAVAGDRLLVCDMTNDRVQVLTTELEPVNVIGGFDYAYDIAVDYEQLLYVADSCEGIKVYTMDGEFRHRFNHEQLVSARGVCVDGGFVYVSDTDRDRVYVFTRDGQFVTSFGDGHVIYPYGITVDSDGFVYVCNTNGVTVF